MLAGARLCESVIILICHYKSGVDRARWLLAVYVLSALVMQPVVIFFGYRIGNYLTLRPMYFELACVDLRRASGSLASWHGVMAPSAVEIAIRGALMRAHGPYKNHVASVVDPLVAYFVNRGDSLVDIPLDVPSSGKVDHERRWRAKLLAAGITDAGDVEDFLLWMDARSAPAGAGGAGVASGLAKVALVALEAAGEKPSAAAMSSLEKALALGESGDEEGKCQCAQVAFLLVWGRDPTPAEEVEWDRQFASFGGREGGRIDITSDEKYGKLQKSSELVGRITLRRALKSADQRMFDAADRTLVGGDPTNVPIWFGAGFRRSPSRSEHFAGCAFGCATGCVRGVAGGGHRLGGG